MGQSPGADGSEAPDSLGPNRTGQWSQSPQGWSAGEGPGQERAGGAHSLCIPLPPSNHWSSDQKPEVKGPTQVSLQGTEQAEKGAAGAGGQAEDEQHIPSPPTGFRCITNYCQPLGSFLRPAFLTHGAP